MKTRALRSSRAESQDADHRKRKVPTATTMSPRHSPVTEVVLVEEAEVADSSRTRDSVNEQCQQPKFMIMIFELVN